MLGSRKSVDQITILANQLRLASFSAAVATYGGQMKFVRVFDCLCFVCVDLGVGHVVVAWRQWDASDGDCGWVWSCTSPSAVG